MTKERRLTVEADVWISLSLATLSDSPLFNLAL
jgi:hypothetical protein